MATDISTPLPQQDLPQGGFLVIDTQDAAVIVTQVVIHGTYLAPGTPLTTPDVLLTVAPGESG